MSQLVSTFLKSKHNDLSLISVLTSCESPPADGSSPFSLGTLSLGELHPETGVLLLLGEESAERHAITRLYISVTFQIKNKTCSLEQPRLKINSHLLLCVVGCGFTQCVWCSLFDDGRSTFFAGERTLAGVQVFLQLVLHLQVGLGCWKIKATLKCD